MLYALMTAMSLLYCWRFTEALLAPVHVLLEVRVQVTQALELAVGPTVDAKVSAP